MSDIKLKPCPLCQSIHVCIMQTSEQDVDSQKYYGFCYNCCAEAGLGDTEEQAAAAWNALPRALHWTTETPTEPGWYWWRKSPSGYTEIKRVSCYFSKGKKALVIRSNKSNTLTGYRNKNIRFVGGEWAGPILAPLHHPRQRRPETGQGTGSQG